MKVDNFSVLQEITSCLGLSLTFSASGGEVNNTVGFTAMDLVLL